MSFFIDLEMPCKKNYSSNHAIIQIGIVSSGNRLQYAKHVFPGKKSSKISAYCTELTGITREDIASADEFPVIYAELKQHFNSGMSKYVWGERDGMVLDNVCERYHLPKIKNIINYQQELKNRFHLTRQHSLLDVCASLGIETNLQHHNALTDAKLLRSIYKRVNNNPEQASILLREVDYKMRIKEIQRQYKDIVDENGNLMIKLPKQQIVVVS